MGLLERADYEVVSSEKRVFARLTALASWRSEYILRTRLLRSLARGKPAYSEVQKGSSRSGPGPAGSAQLTYNSNLVTTVNHLDANFRIGPNKRLSRFIHGADEIGMASTSDPINGKVDSWGFSDAQGFLQFADRFPGEAEYGLGTGDIVGIPNVMDLSQAHGVMYAESSPGGLLYYRSSNEHRGRALAASLEESNHERGIPGLNPARETICAIWIAKTTKLASLTGGIIGMLSGSSYGVVTAFSLGTDGLPSGRLERGEITARWVLSPGVPIVKIVIDENYSLSKHSQSRIWAVVLNALGEVYYLKDFPSRTPRLDFARRPAEMYELAWETGRTVYWCLAEPTRRVATVDPYNTSSFDGSYSPRSSCNSMGLDKAQIAAETKEIERFVKEKPKYFQKVCEGWDMQRKLEVDFAGDDTDGAGEAVFVFQCGVNGGQPVNVKRFVRFKLSRSEDIPSSWEQSARSPSATSTPSSSPGSSIAISPSGQPRSSSKEPTFSRGPNLRKDTLTEKFDAWSVSNFAIEGVKSTQISTTAIDQSTFALVTTKEDPLLNPSMSSMISSPSSSPMSVAFPPRVTADIPGQRSRFIAAGTMTGSIIIWDARAPAAKHSEVLNTISPVTVIHTDSPQISCLALTALYLVHGGNDGLVQAWDPLVSSAQPIRTLNSRFSSRARRRLIQAAASPLGVNVNLFAAGAICLDPDPTVLRGMVSLGTHLRYWSYSSQAADQYKSNKRRLRRIERGSNRGGEKFSHTGRGALKDYIANERMELEQEKENRRKETARLQGRFGVDLLGLGATDDEIMAYATMLSEDSAKADEARRKSDSSSSAAVTETMSSPVAYPMSSNDESGTDAEVAEAIRLSLEEVNPVSDEPNHSADFPIRYETPVKSDSGSPPTVDSGSSHQHEFTDLEFAMQLSLAEERSRAEVEEDFPPLFKGPSPPMSGKGKERRKS